MKLSSAIVAAIVVAPSASAAVQVGATPTLHRGMAAAWSAGLSIEGSSSHVLLKPPGRVTAPIQGWAAQPGISNPDFSLTALAANHPLASALGGSPIDAMSTGRSRIPRHDGTGIPGMSGQQINWLAVAVSVSSDSLGSAGHIERLTSASIDPGAEIIAHYMDPGGALDPNLTGKTLVETRRSDLGFAQSGSENINMLDYALGAMTFNESTAASTFFYPTTNEIYFSISAAWSQANSSALFAADSGGTLTYYPHPGDVYHMEWNTGTNAWDLPTIHISKDDLVEGTETVAELFDVDALDIDPEELVVVYSATLEAGLSDQLMVYQEQDLSTSVNAQRSTSRPLRENTGRRVTYRLGITDLVDEVDALCTYDPEVGNYDDLCATASTGPWQQGGWAMAPLWQSGDRVGVSVARRSDAGAGPVFTDDLEVLFTGFGGTGVAEDQLFYLCLFSDTHGLAIGAPVLRPATEDTFKVTLPVWASSGTEAFHIFGYFDKPAALPATGSAPGYPRASWFGTLVL